MSRLTDIKAKINVLEGGAFQELCDALLARKDMKEFMHMECKLEQ